MLARVTRVAKTCCSHSSLWSWSGERYLGFEKLEHLFPFQRCQIDFLHVIATYLQMFLPNSCHTALNVFVGLVNRIVGAVHRWRNMLPDLPYFMNVAIDLVVYRGPVKISYLKLPILIQIPKIYLFNII